MIKDSSLTRRVSAALFLVALACAQAFAQSQRTVRQYVDNLGGQSPLEVVSVKVKGATVESGRPFAGGDDWLDGLTITVKNVSDRPITFVDIRLLFPTPAGSERKSVDLLGLIRYGCWPGYPCYADAAGSTKEIMPGQTHDMVLTAEAYQRLLIVLARLGAQTPVVSAEYELDSAFFDPETRWSRGQLFKRDPSDPNKFKSVGRYVLPQGHQ